MGAASDQEEGPWRWIRPLALAAAAVAVVGGAWFALSAMDGPAGGAIVADPTDRELVQLGRTVYAAQCASCHGGKLEGQADWRTRLPDGSLRAPPHDETGHTWHHPDAQLFEVVKKGGQAMAPAGFKSNMPAFGGTLSDREILASLAYIKSRWPAEVRSRHDQINRRAQ